MDLLGKHVALLFMGDNKARILFSSDNALDLQRQVDEAIKAFAVDAGIIQRYTVVAYPDGRLEFTPNGRAYGVTNRRPKHPGIGFTYERHS